MCASRKSLISSQEEEIKLLIIYQGVNVAMERCKSYLQCSYNEAWNIIKKLEENIEPGQSNQRPNGSVF